MQFPSITSCLSPSSLFPGLHPHGRPHYFQHNISFRDSFPFLLSPCVKLSSFNMAQCKCHFPSESSSASPECSGFPLLGVTTSHLCHQHHHLHHLLLTQLGLQAFHTVGDLLGLYLCALWAAGDEEPRALWIAICQSGGQTQKSTPRKWRRRNQRHTVERAVMRSEWMEERKNKMKKEREIEREEDKKRGTKNGLVDEIEVERGSQKWDRYSEKVIKTLSFNFKSNQMNWISGKKKKKREGNFNRTIPAHTYWGETSEGLLNIKWTI